MFEQYWLRVGLTRAALRLGLKTGAAVSWHTGQVMTR